MKYESLPIIASSLRVLSWVVVALGVISSVLLGKEAATVPASITFLILGLLVTAIFALMLLATSRLIYLFLDIEEHLSKIAGGKEPKQ